MIRDIISVIAGLATAILVFLIVEKTNALLHPTPVNVDFGDRIQVKKYYENQHMSLWLMVLAGWFIGSFLCGFLIKLISRNTGIKLPIIAGSILTLSAVANFLSFPHPVWFIVVGLLVFIPSTLTGHRLNKITYHGNK